MSIQENPYRPPEGDENSSPAPHRVRPLGIFLLWFLGVALPTGVFMLVSGIGLPLFAGRICLVMSLLSGWAICAYSVFSSKGSFAQKLLLFFLSLPMPFVFFGGVGVLIIWHFGAIRE